MKKSDLRISEIFYSLQGESTTMGLATVFIRLTGCPLRCGYCDTAYAFSGGKIMSIAKIKLHIKSFDSKYVCITGGEPLAQAACIDLMQQLCDDGYLLSIETSGALSIAKIDNRVTVVMDLKTPGSGECEKNIWDNIGYLKPQDQIKFVLCDQADYEWACKIITERKLNTYAHILFSPSWGQLDPSLLANWILRDRLSVRFQLQLHKILWNDARGH